MTLVRYESKSNVATTRWMSRSRTLAINPALCNELCEVVVRFRDTADRLRCLDTAAEAYFSAAPT